MAGATTVYMYMYGCHDSKGLGRVCLDELNKKHIIQLFNLTHFAMLTPLPKLIKLMRGNLNTTFHLNGL